MTAGWAGASSGTGLGHLYVGSYAPAGQGIQGFAIDAAGGLRPLALTPNAHSPSWLLADPATGRLIAAEEGGDHVAVYQQQADGGLLLRQRLPSGGRGPVHLSRGLGHLWVAHYGDARLTALPWGADARLGEARTWYGEAGGHAHMLAPSPDGRWLVASDLGLNRLLVWPAGDPPPGAAQVLQRSAGRGPRHFVFHPQRPDLLYLLQELSNSLLTVQLGDGGPEALAECSVLPVGHAGTSYASDLLLAPGGRHLYALNRLHNSIAVLDLADPRQPRLLDHHGTHGDYPRSACQVGSHLYVCNQRSDQLSHFDLSRPAQPRFSGLQVAVPSPAVACLL